MSTQSYKTNLNCGQCVAAVKPYLDQAPEIDAWSVDTNHPDKILTLSGSDLSSEKVGQLVSEGGFRVLGPTTNSPAAGNLVSLDTPVIQQTAPPRGFLTTYKPLLLVLAYLIGAVLVVETATGHWSLTHAMQIFMGGFFVAFSFFKMLDLKGFVDSYQSYDILARNSREYGYFYPFLEVGLGVAYLLNIAPIVTNGVTLVVMLIGLWGVTVALVKKRKIACACLGTLFNLPMTKVTFIEDAVMATMAAVMLVKLLG
ncbi:MAG: hypothetical protein KDA78_03190 [Planctomycetaceae bacterium]|nr:hypothetical protein [Planctomycetaceae bacterium]